MKKKKLLWLCLLLPLLTGCSSDNDSITINNRNILGYWEIATSGYWMCTTNTTAIDVRRGLLFTAEGEIKSWEISPQISFDNSQPSDNGQYSEVPWGTFWFEDDGTLEIQNRPKNSEPYPDELYYKVISLTGDRLVIRTFGGFFGTPLEKGTDVVYKKTDKPNK
jgi:hypothetical protein